MKKEEMKENDYLNKDRPLNRRGQFFDIFKHRFVELMKLSFLQAVFNVPLIVSLVLFYVLVKNATNLSSLMTVFLIQGGSFLISMPSIFVGMTGTYYCMKKLIYAEGEFASSSFFTGLLEEWKKGLIIGLIAGFSSALAVIGFFFFFFYLSSVNSVISGFGIAILGVQFVAALTLCYYALAQVVFYSNKLQYVLKNAWIFTLIRFPSNLLFFIIHPGIFIALFCIMDITMYVGIILLLIFVAFFHLMWVCNMVTTFDKFINKEYYPEYYRKGLRDIKEEA